MYKWWSEPELRDLCTQVGPPSGREVKVSEPGEARRCGAASGGEAAQWGEGTDSRLRAMRSTSLIPGAMRACWQCLHGAAAARAPD